MRVPGALKWIASGWGIVVGVNKIDKIYYRTQVSRKFPTGKRWVNVPGRLAQIDVHGMRVYGRNSKHFIYMSPLAKGKGKRGAATVTFKAVKGYTLHKGMYLGGYNGRRGRKGFVRLNKAIRVCNRRPSKFQRRTFVFRPKLTE